MSRGRSQQVIVSALIGCALAGCGGGGGGGNRPPPPPTLTLSLQAIKAFHFAWTAVPGVTHYKLLEDPAGNSGFTQVGADINASVTSLDHFVPLHRRINARYILQACAAARCSDSNTVTAPGSLGEAVGYFKAQSISLTDVLGTSVALSADGATLAVGMPLEDSDATGVGGDPANDRAVDSGAVYVFARVGAGPAWVQQAYIKASNAGAFDRFGHRVALDAGGATLAVGAPDEDESGATYVFERSGGAWTEQALLKSSNAEKDDGFGDSLALSGDGRTLAVGARFEDSGAIGIGGNAGDNSAVQAGAVYVFVKEGFAWRQDAYIKASNTGQGDQFGTSVALSANGAMLAVGADGEDSGIAGAQADESAPQSGAVYVFSREALWMQQAYLKASTIDDNDFFGDTLALSGDGSTLAVAATTEDSAATGIDGNESDDTAGAAGAAYVFVRTGSEWRQQAYVKASNTAAGDLLGRSLALSGDGSALAVGAPAEDSSARGIGADESDNSAENSGAVYFFERANGTWTQRAYVKPSNTPSSSNLSGFLFGESVALSADGATLAVGAPEEHGSATGVDGNQDSPPVEGAGAVYLY